MKNLQEYTLDKSYIYKGNILTLRKDNILLPNGKAATREVVEHSGGAAVFAIDKSDNVYLTRQYRYPYSSELVEIPAGKLDSNESPDACAIRELREETGLIAQSVTAIGRFFPSPGYTDEIIHIFFADTFLQHDLALDEDEFLELVKIPYSTLLDMVLSNQIADAKTVIAVLWYNATMRANNVAR